jgi:hypothetical protein
VNSAIIGFRYNSASDIFELNATTYQNGARFVSSPVVCIPAEQNFQTQIRRLSNNKVQLRVKAFPDVDRGFEAKEGYYIWQYQRENLSLVTRKVGTSIVGSKPLPTHFLIYRKEIDSWN